MSLRQFLLNTLSSLKARLRAFWRENSEIKRAAIVQAAVIFSVPRLKCSRERPLFELDSNKRWGKMRPLSGLLPGSILKLGLGALDQYCTHQETISGRPEQVYLPFDQDWIDLEGGGGVGGAIFDSDSTKHREKDAATIRGISGPLLKSGLGSLARYCTHQDTIGGTSEQKYFHLTQDLEWPGEGPLSSWTQINAGAQNEASVRVIPCTIIEFRPGLLVRYSNNQETISGRPE